MLDKRRRPLPLGSDDEEEEIAYEDAWYRSLKARAERQAAGDAERQAAAQPERRAGAEPERDAAGD